MTTGTEKPPKGKEARFYWYAERCEHFMAVTEGPVNRQWRWRAYQSLLYFAHKRRQALGTFGTYALGEDEGRMRRCRDSLRADGIEIQAAIDCYFERIVPADPWHREKGASVTLFTMAETQNKIKALLAPAPSGIMPSAGIEQPKSIAPEPLPFWAECPDLQQAVKDGHLLAENVQNLSWTSLGLVLEQDGPVYDPAITYCDGRGRQWHYAEMDEPEYLPGRCEHCAEHARESDLSAPSEPGMLADPDAEKAPQGA
jgi:hypothetical protein